MRLARAQSRVLAAAVVALTAAGCGGGQDAAGSASSGSPTASAVPTPPEARAAASLQGRSGAALTGTATFVQTGDEPVRIVVRVEDASPGLHGLHVHEKGDCSDPEAQAAGGHFNPARSPHAGPDAKARHAGDLGNIEVREDGTGDLSITSDVLAVQPGPLSVVGRAVVVHASEDDLRTQPTGNAGARVGCGVVTAATK